MLAWLNLDENQISRLKSFHFPLNLEIEEYDGALDYILSVLRPGDPNKENHNVVKSVPYIRQLVGDEEKKDRKRYSALKVTKFYNAIYHSSVQTVQSIAAHLRETILKDHKPCLKRLMKSSWTNEPICPYALAYAHWMKFILGYESITLIVRKAYPHRKYANSIEFGSKQDYSYLFDLFQMWQFEVEDFTEESQASAKWVFNRVMGHLIWNHFNNWLSISQEAAANRLEYREVPFGLRDLPFYILIIPKSKKVNIAFNLYHPCNLFYHQVQRSLPPFAEAFTS